MSETRWQRFWKWLREKPLAERRIRGYRYLALFFACYAVFFLCLGYYSAFSLAQIYKASQIPAIDDILKAWNSLAFLSSFSAVSGMMGFSGLFMFIFALCLYSFSLELRIKELEKKTKEKC